MLKIVVVASISTVFVSALVLYTAPNNITSSRHHWTSMPLLLAMKPPLIETQQQQKQREDEKSSNHDSSSSRGGVRVAYLGNSIQYYNDCPRFLTNLSHRGAIVHQDSCLRGGATLVTLWTKGNGMQHKFATMNAKTTVLPPVGENGRGGGGNANDDEYVVYDVGSSTVQDLLTTSLVLGCDPNNKDRWDYVVVNDHTQGPARPVSQKKHEQILLDKYLPLIIDNGATPIIIETHAYRYPGINNSEDLGSTPHEFTHLVRKGVQSYIHALRTKLPETIQPRMAPVGTAFLHVHDDNYKVWERLFDPFDHFHPSPSGTFLQGCVLHWTMFDSPPPLPRSDEEIRDLWKDARVMHDVKKNGDQGPPLPTMIEAEYLWNVAKIICETDL